MRDRPMCVSSLPAFSLAPLSFSAFNLQHTYIHRSTADKVSVDSLCCVPVPQAARRHDASQSCMQKSKFTQACSISVDMKQSLQELGC